MYYIANLAQQFLYKLCRFGKFEELNPIELKKLIEGGGNETCASEITVPFDMKRLVLDVISEEKIS